MFSVPPITPCTNSDASCVLCFQSEMEMVFGAIRYGQDVQQEVNEMMDVLDKNKDGFIDYKGESACFCVQTNILLFTMKN